MATNNHIESLFDDFLKGGEMLDELEKKAGRELMTGADIRQALKDYGFPSIKREKKKWKNGWKVIRADRYSCTASERAFPVKYPKNKIALRPMFCGPLAVFETREAARRFKRSYELSYYIKWDNTDQWKIVKCKYIKSGATALWEDSHYRRHHFPPRTVLATKVKCLE
jgi:hypothetical protein